MLELTDENFIQEVLENNKVVLVDFWMPGCPPCEQIAPVIGEIAREFEDKAKVGKLNVRQNPKTTQKYEIRGVPTLIIFKDGEPKERATGPRPKKVLIEKINSLI